ncbi:MAG: hypothetical protein ALECFALPRED_003651 [Alectoria fallacina]|uniref:BTB domain-containing protein n=1 Tax=Alectoria fallacina TaxID=1903189 RepID=A0A8H3IUK5_9LECA|nr:MAG: hypothetical protein ALECFALPRED_003651 [Alectoria fallacina]
MFDGGFKESSTAILPLDHDDPATVERMVTFLYTGKYDQGNPDITVQDANHAWVPSSWLILWSTPSQTIASAAWSCKDFFPSIVAQSLRHDSRLPIQVCETSAVWSVLLTNNGAIGLSILQNHPHQRSVEEVGRAKDGVEAKEQEQLDWLISCNDRLHWRFDEAHEDLDSLVDKWGENGGTRCDECGDSLFEGLKRDLVDFKKALPKSEESVFL